MVVGWHTTVRTDKRGVPFARWRCSRSFGHWRSSCNNSRTDGWLSDARLCGLETDTRRTRTDIHRLVHDCKYDFISSQYTKQTRLGVDTISPARRQVLPVPRSE